MITRSSGAVAASLAGRRVLITRAADDADAWESRLREVGAVPVVLPCIRREWMTDQATRLALATALDGADWLVLASAAAAEATALLLSGVLPKRTRIAVVGPTTARAAEIALRAPNLVARKSTSAALGHELGRIIRNDSSGERVVVVIAAAEGGRTDADEALHAAGAEVRRVNVYRTVATPPVRTKHDLNAEGIDAVLLASPSAVEGFMNQVRLPVSAKVVTIGPTTTQAATVAGLVVSAEATEQSLDGMLEVL